MTSKAVIGGVLVLVVVLASGCLHPVRSGGGGDGFPAEAAGTWKARQSPWKIVISPDGKVSSAVVDFGEVEIRPNKTTKVEMKDDSISTYKAGDCTVEYSPATRELFVKIVLEKIRVVYLDNVIEGNSTDRFVGPVSADGKEWSADWIKVFDYGPRFPQDANDIYAVPLVFEKVEE